jgi:hypothetical protein
MTLPSITHPEIQTLVREGVAATAAASSSQSLQDVKVHYLGKSGLLAAPPYFQTIKDATPEQKKSSTQIVPPPPLGRMPRWKGASWSWKQKN